MKFERGMGMRELKRSVAKANMRDAGFERLFKPKLAQGDNKRRSTFARHWKEWIQPKGNRAKLLARARVQRTARKRMKMGRVAREGGRAQ